MRYQREVFSREQLKNNQRKKKRNDLTCSKAKARLNKENRAQFFTKANGKKNLIYGADGAASLEKRPAKVRLG